MRDNIEYLTALADHLSEVEDGDDLTLGTRDVAMFAGMLRARVAVLERRRAWQKAWTALRAALWRRPEPAIAA